MWPANCCARTRLNEAQSNFGLMGPDETASNRLDAVFEVTDRMSTAEILPGDEYVAPDGRVLEVLSEHICQGWLEGYLLTGRHGFFSCYEASIHILDSMFSQHAKWLKVAREIGWRRPTASLNYLLTSHVWQQDHNGFSHQDPGFIDHVASKKAEVVRIYLPPDANTLLSVTDHCLRSRGTSTSTWRASRRSPSVWTWLLPFVTAAWAPASGAGPATTRGYRRTWRWPARATCPRWKPWRRSICCASTCLSCGCGWSTWWIC